LLKCVSISLPSPNTRGGITEHSAQEAKAEGELLARVAEEPCRRWKLLLWNSCRMEWKCFLVIMGFTIYTPFWFFWWKEKILITIC